MCVPERERERERERESQPTELVCVPERERERERESQPTDLVCVPERERQSAYRASVCVCVPEREGVSLQSQCVCVCVYQREGVSLQSLCVCVCVYIPERESESAYRASVYQRVSLQSQCVCTRERGRRTEKGHLVVRVRVNNPMQKSTLFPLNSQSRKALQKDCDPVDHSLAHLGSSGVGEGHQEHH